MLDTVDDFLILITENDVAVFAHDLYDQLFLPEIAKFIQMFNLESDDAFQTRLRDPGDPPVTDVLAEKHAEIGGSHGTGLIDICQVDQRKRSTCADAETELSGRRFDR